MQLKKKVIYAGIVSAATLITSIFIPIIPCRIAPGIPNPIYKWTLCSLNPDKISSIGSITKYFGYTTSLRDTYLLTLFIIFAVVMLFLYYTTIRRKKN
ncbi:hypothetical protein KAT36_04645 [Candidatus Pacearchaeota archaeon]|nr:hypothetical protein [Candidatus Pacearchaeota archaeon]